MALSADNVRNAVFSHASRLKQGYDMAEVDDFLDEVARTLDGVQASTRQPTPEPDSQAVAELRQRVRYLEGQLARNAQAAQGPNAGAAAELAVVRRERDDARRQVQHLRDAAQSNGGDGIDPRAVNLLSQAQASADQTIAEADRYAQELVTSARRQFQEILLNARELGARAESLNKAQSEFAAKTEDSAKDKAEDVRTAPPGPDIDEMRNYAELAHAQLETLISKLTPEAPLPARESDAQQI
ncbi:DivIVA domain-containing protein [Rhodococcus sp. NPDC058521]|uniref:DivIVA domain-containing protein n=1 Tax=Rhodococcus sp. NPDC058521 TaxID=3346536 RepID=UPI003657835C